MAMTMKNAVIWDVAPCGYFVNRHFGGTSVNKISTWHHIPEDNILLMECCFVVQAVFLCKLTFI
jgi:hypothetical protein